jgi:hypothetical protein
MFICVIKPIHMLLFHPCGQLIHRCYEFHASERFHSCSLLMLCNSSFPHILSLFIDAVNLIHMLQFITNQVQSPCHVSSMSSTSRAWSSFIIMVLSLIIINFFSIWKPIGFYLCGEFHLHFQLWWAPYSTHHNMISYGWYWFKFHLISYHNN